MDPIRKSRIESAIIRTLASHFVSGKVKDPRIQLVSIHRASISPDLSLVKVWVTSYCDEKGKKRLLDALKHASGYLQSVI
ncbi:MAG: 30S ribosome-binding factor RbfA, partial [Leptospiraceae bacterium]|nr:30S ribosome-binding factor RbfA [Leptospiraceae bacterium]